MNKIQLKVVTMFSADHKRLSRRHFNVLVLERSMDAIIEESDTVKYSLLVPRRREVAYATSPWDAPPAFGIFGQPQRTQKARTSSMLSITGLSAAAVAMRRNAIG